MSQCMHWSREGKTGQGNCSIGAFKGRPYVGNCAECEYKVGPDSVGGILMTYSTTNLGDDIQAVAVAELMGGISATCDRTNLGTTKHVGKMLLAGWFKHPEDTWPPAAGITPLFVAWHADDPRCVTDHVEYLKQHEPIGCRDIATMELCRKHGIDAYWSGCATLTLKRDRVLGQNPLAVDIQVDGVQNLTNGIKHAPDRIGKAQAMIDRLARAKCVVTSRLHIAMPCAAMGVPVLLVHAPDKRFTGLSQFVHHMPERDDEAIRAFIENPPENPNKYLLDMMAFNLREKVARFLHDEPKAWDKMRKARSLVQPAEVGRWTVTTPASKLDPLPTPEFWGTRKSELYAPYQITEMPERGVLEIENGIAATNNCTPISPDGRVISDLCWWSGQRKYRLPLPITYNEPLKLAGKTLLLGSEWSHCNYGHWLMDSIGRLSTLQQAGRSLDEFDHFLMNDWKGMDAARVIDGIGLDRRKIVTISGNDAIECEQMTVPSFAGVSCSYLPIFAEFLRRAVKPEQWSHGDRIYVRRGNITGRAMPNEERMESIAKKHGFKITDPWSGNTIPDFAGASVVVGIHSAGISNVVFCKPGTLVMEIVPNGHQLLYYRSLSDICGLRYSVIMGKSTHPQIGRKFGMFCKSPVDVNLVDFEHAICSLITQP